MKRINREAIQRMVDARGGKAGGTNGGGGGSLAGYATQAWVNEGFVSIEFFNRLFTVYGPGETSSGPDVVIEPNDLDSTIKNIEAMFGFWTEYYVSALGNGGDLGSTLYLSSLADVALTSAISDGQVLKYNLSTGKWTNATLSLTTTLGGLTDVLLTGPAANQVLVYDGTQWVNCNLKTINNNSLIGAGNIDISGGGNGNYLWITSGSSLNANSCYADSGLYLLSSGSFSNVPGSGYGQILLLPYRAGHGNSSPDYGAQIYIPCGDDATYPNTMFFRTSLRNSFNPWQEVATVNSLSGYFLPLTGGTLTGKLTVNAVIYGYNYTNNNNAASFVFDKRGSNQTGIGGHNQDNVIWFGACNSNGIWVDNYKQIWKFNGDIYADYVRIEQKNEINSYYSDGGNGLFLNYRTNGNVTIALGGGSVGIGTEPSYKLHVAGTIYATGNVTSLSDARFKDVLGDVKIGVEQIAAAPAVQFRWKGERAKEGLQVGTLAQYWQGVLPEVVMDRGGELSMQYGVAAMVSAIVTARKVVDHERRITELERENERLRTEIEQLRLN